MKKAQDQTARSDLLALEFKDTGDMRWEILRVEHTLLKRAFYKGVLISSIQVAFATNDDNVGVMKEYFVLGARLSFCWVFTINEF